MFKARKTCQVEAQTLILLNRDIDMFLMQKCKNVAISVSHVWFWISIFAFYLSQQFRL